MNSGEKNTKVLVTVDLERESSMNKFAGISSFLRKLVGEKIANFILESAREFLSFMDTLPPKRYGKSEKGAVRLLDLFDSLGIKATFFSTGKMALENKSLIEDIAKEGHEIGSHGFEHENFRRLPESMRKDRIEKSMKILERTTEEDVTLKSFLKIFPAYLLHLTLSEKTPRLQKFLTDQGAGGVLLKQ